MCSFVKCEELLVRVSSHLPARVLFWGVAGGCLDFMVVGIACESSCGIIYEWVS